MTLDWVICKLPSYILLENYRLTVPVVFLVCKLYLIVTFFIHYDILLGENLCWKEVFVLAKIDYSQLRATVKKKGLTLIELARKANVSHSVLCRLSSNQSVSLSSIAKICEALSCSITDVVNIDLDGT